MSCYYNFLCVSICHRRCRSTSKYSSQNNKSLWKSNNVANFFSHFSSTASQNKEKKNTRDFRLFLIQLCRWVRLYHSLSYFMMYYAGILVDTRYKIIFQLFSVPTLHLSQTHLRIARKSILTFFTVTLLLFFYRYKINTDKRKKINKMIFKDFLT